MEKLSTEAKIPVQVGRGRSQEFTGWWYGLACKSWVLWLKKVKWRMIVKEIQFQILMHTYTQTHACTRTHTGMPACTHILSILKAKSPYTKSCLYHILRLFPWSFIELIKLGPRVWEERERKKETSEFWKVLCRLLGEMCIAGHIQLWTLLTYNTNCHSR